MIFHYLSEVRKHISMVAFLAFAGWLAFLAGLEMVFGRDGIGDEPDISLPPVIVARPPALPTTVTSPTPPVTTTTSEPSSNQKTPSGNQTNNKCLNIEGTVICEGG